MHAQKRTVLHLTGMGSAKYGAMEQYLEQTVQTCSDRGLDSVIQYETPPVSTEYVERLKALGARVVVLETRARNPRSLVALWSLLRDVRPRIINTHFSARHVIACAATAGRLLGARRVVSMVHNVHGLTPRSLARLAYNRCDRVLAVSDGVKADLLNGAVSPALVTTHYMGLFGERKRSPGLRARFRAEFGIPEDAVVLGNIAFDAPFKGVDVLVEALGQVLASRSDVYLLQVGVDPRVSALPQQAAELGIAPNIRWAGIRDQGWKLLNAVDVYVQPSRFGEGLPLAIMEAMAMQLPVVATDVAGNIEGVENGVTGLIVAPQSVEALANAILRMASERNEWGRTGAAGGSRFQALFEGRRSVDRLVDQHYLAAPAANNAQGVSVEQGNS